jgi:D-galactarolactone cycloisomerase
MRISDVLVSLHSCPMKVPEIIPAWDSWRIILNPTEAVAKVVTDNGVTGFGMGGVSSFEVARDVIAPALRGSKLEDARDIDEIWSRIENLVPDEGTRNAAAGGIDIALWDCLGKASNKSVCELMGGRRQDRIKIYASAGLIYRDPERNVDEAKAFRDGEIGFTAYKYKSAQGPDNDIRSARLLRDALGDTYTLMFDGHYFFCKSGNGDYMYQPRTVKRIARELEKLNAYWFEEPLPHQEVSLNKELKATLSTMLLATGESCKTLGEYEALLKNDACDIVQGEPATFGGITQCRKIIELAAQYGKMFVPHNWGPRITAAANAQLCAAYPSKVAPWNEMSMFATEHHPGLFKWPLVEEMLTKPLEMSASYLTVPRGPGLGVEVNEQALKKHPFINVPYNAYIYSVPTSYMPSYPTRYLPREYFGKDDEFKRRNYLW